MILDKLEEISNSARFFRIEKTFYGFESWFFKGGLEVERKVFDNLKDAVDWLYQETVGKQ